MNNKENRRQGQLTEKIRRADLVLFVICMLMAVFSGLMLLWNRHEGTVVRISGDGEVLAEIALEVTGTQYYVIWTGDGRAMIESCGGNYTDPDMDGYNLLSVSDGVVWMEAADCRDQICVRHSAVSAEGESIICLPHKLVVEITAGADNGDPSAKERPENNRNGSAEKKLREATNEALDGVVE